MANNSKSAGKNGTKQGNGGKKSRLDNDPLVQANGRRTQSLGRVQHTPVSISRRSMRQTLFSPHATRGQTIMMRPLPRIAFTQHALDKMGAYVGLMNQEIAWMSTVEKRGNTYLITDCHLFGQAVHGATAEIDPEQLGELIHEILVNDPENGVNVVNSLKCWGHSHVNMAVHPSGQDDRQMDDFGETVDDYMIRVIANKHGDIRCDVWDYAAGLIHADLPWSLYTTADNDRLNAVAEEIEAKVSQISYVSAKKKGGKGSGGNVVDTTRDLNLNFPNADEGAQGDGGSLFYDDEDGGFEDQFFGMDPSDPDDAEQIAAQYGCTVKELATMMEVNIVYSTDGRPSLDL